MGLIRVINREGIPIDMIDRQMQKGTKGKLKNKWYVTYNNKKYIVRLFAKNIPSIHL